MSTAKERSADWTGVTKWIVIGAVIVITLLILKKPIERLLDRAQEVQVDPTSGNITIRTTQTAIGELKVSSEKVNEHQAEQIVQEKSTQRNAAIESDFMLTWPKGTWQKAPEFLPQLEEMYRGGGVEAEALLACRQTMPNSENFQSNVYIVRSPYNNAYSFETQMQANKAALMSTMGDARFLTEEIDPETKGATFIFTYSYLGVPCYQIQRYGYKNGYTYQLVATTTVADAESQAQIRTIVNSFRIVE
jgi:hypothetical protein